MSGLYLKVYNLIFVNLLVLPRKLFIIAQLYVLLKYINMSLSDTLRLLLKTEDVTDS
jgi:hypothetical protein